MNRPFFINSQLTRNGLTLKTPRGVYSLIYPVDVWGAYPKNIKSVLIDNLALLLTINLPLVGGLKEVNYNTSMPFFLPFFFEIITESIPSAIEDYPYSTESILKRFLNIDFCFKEEAVKIPAYRPNFNFREKAIVPLSFGKDSLLTLALAFELGLEPVGVYINDTVSPREDKIKLKAAREISKEFGFKIHVVTNHIEKLNDFEFWDKDETCLGYMHMLTGFCFMLLPFVHFYKAKYILVGNQQDMNFAFKNKDGYRTHPSPDQRSKWMRLQSAAISLMTAGQVRVLSIIEPLTNIAIIKLLHTHYPKLGKYEISCDSLDASRQSRWCCNCAKCARLVLFMKAFGIDTKKIGLKKDLFNKSHKKLYSLFNGAEVDVYERSIQAKMQQLLAFYLAYERGEEGALIDRFKKDFLPLSQSKIKLLKKEFFRVYKTELPDNIKKKLTPLLKKLLI